MVTQSLRLLPSTINFPLSEIILTPYMPVPETNGEEWDRLEPASALDALVELVLHGEYNGLESAKRLKDGLELRAVSAVVFEVSIAHFLTILLKQVVEFRAERRDQICNCSSDAPS